MGRANENASSGTVALVVRGVPVCWLVVGRTGKHCVAAEKNAARDRLKASLKERVDTAKAIYDHLLDKYEHGAGNIGAVHRAKVAWMTARLSLTETKSERLKIYEEIVKDAKEWEQTALHNVETGAGQTIEALTAKADRIEAEIALSKRSRAAAGEDSSSQAVNAIYALLTLHSLDAHGGLVLRRFAAVVVGRRFVGLQVLLLQDAHLGTVHACGHLFDEQQWCRGLKPSAPACERNCRGCTPRWH